MLEKHINDSDSDVERESKAACRALGIEFVEVNPETLRRNIINGDGEDFDAWVDRLVITYDEADSVSDLRTLSRSKALWSAVGTDVLENKWFSWASSSNWIHREIAGILAQVNGDVMLDSSVFPRAADVVTELQRLVNDNDSDVTRESRLACDENGIEYTLDCVTLFSGCALQR